MKGLCAFALYFLPLILHAQAPDAAYIRELYKRYPTQPSDHCPSCKLWINPFYSAIGDTLQHIPVLTFYIYTKAHRLEQETLDLPRTGAYASWHPVYGQPDETKVYKEANRIIGKPNSSDMIAKGHCQPWILLAWNPDAAMLSNTYTFNAGMEFQGQNIGTQLATEELCRKLTGFRTPAVTDSVRIWCGTFGNKKTYTKSGISVSVPTHYYKIINYHDANLGGDITQCYWMPNDPSEKRAFAGERVIPHAELVQKLGFDPMAALGQYPATDH